MSEQDQPTPSPLCNYLIEAASRVREGTLAVDALKETIRENHRLFTQARDETMANIRAQGEEHARTYAQEIADLRASFVEMEAAFNLLARFADTLAEEDYRQAVDRLTVAGHMAIGASSAYTRAELRQGPTPMPLLNLLHIYKDHYLAGEARREDFAAAIQGAAAMARAAAEELENAEVRVEGQEELAAAYRRFAEVVERLERALDAGREALEKGLEEAEEEARRVRFLMEEYTARRTTTGPTDNAHVNFILNLAEAHARRQVADSVLARGLEVYRKASQELESELESLASIPSDSAVAEEMTRVREAFEVNRVALSLFESYLQGNAEALEGARQKLIEAAHLLSRCKERFDRIAEMEGKVPCVRCGALNAPDHNTCIQCGAQLIVPAGREPAAASTLSIQEEGGEARIPGGLVMTENLMRLFESVNQVAEGRMEPGEFEGVLSWMEGLIQENLLVLPPTPVFPREGLDEEAAEQVARVEEELGRARDDIETGGQEFLGALGRLRRFLEDGDKEHLVRGVREVRDAAAKIQRAHALIEELAEASSASG